MSDPLMSVYPPSPVTFHAGSGAWLTASDGTSYLDMVAGIAVASVGHAHPKVAAAIARQAENLIHVSNLYGTSPAPELAERLSHLTGGMRGFFANSGAEAIECALKLVRRFGGGERYEVIAAEGGFHGRTMGALAATGQPGKRAPFEPLPGGFTHVPFGDVGAIEAAAGDFTVAVLLEPIQGEAGVIVPPPGYLAEVRALCDHLGLVLIVDEIQTGLGRTGEWFAFEHESVVPDVVCIGKALAGGLPMSACFARDEIASAFMVGDHATTFGGGPVQAAAALAVLDVIEEEGLLERSKKVGEVLAENIASFLPPGGEIRGKGAMIGVEVPGKAAAIAQACFERRLLVNPIGKDVIRLVPPLVITEGDLEKALGILEVVFGEI